MQHLQTPHWLHVCTNYYIKYSNDFWIKGKSKATIGELIVDLQLKRLQSSSQHFRFNAPRSHNFQICTTRVSNRILKYLRTRFCFLFWIQMFVVCQCHWKSLKSNIKFWWCRLYLNQGWYVVPYKAHIHVCIARQEKTLSINVYPVNVF